MFVDDEFACNISIDHITYTIKPLANTFDIRKNELDCYVGFYVKWDHFHHFLYIECIIKKFNFLNSNFMLVLLNTNTHSNLKVGLNDVDTTFLYQDIVGNLAFASLGTWGKNILGWTIKNITPWFSWTHQTLKNHKKHINKLFHNLFFNEYIYYVP